MARRKRRSSIKPTSPSEALHPSARRWSGYLTAFGLGVVLTIGVFELLGSQGVTEPMASVGFSSETQQPLTLGDLLTSSPDQVSSVEVAEMNLLCATGLPGAENLAVGKCLVRLDEWAQHVRHETNRHLYRAHDPRYADHYSNSENRLRAEMLAQVLQEDCGVRYNMERMRKIDFTKSEDLFIHGMIGSDNGGTCVSMPVLYVAVGRRLGYPLKLVLTKGHVFARWDGPNGGEGFNIETTGNGGTDSYSDEHYRSWPQPLTDAEVRAGGYLKSLSPAEELACFLAARGHCLLDNGRTQEAQVAYAAAHRFAPKDPLYMAWLNNAIRQEPARPVNAALGYRWRPSQRRDVDAELRRIQAINEYNRRLVEQARLPQPPIPGQPPR